LPYAKRKMTDGLKSVQNPKTECHLFNIRCQKHQTLSPEEPVHILTTQIQMFIPHACQQRKLIISGQEQYTMPMKKSAMVHGVTQLK
jgi:hypothetical protein